MDTVRKTYKYIKDDIEKQLYIEAKLTIKALLITKDSLMQENSNITIADIFEKVYELDVKTISLLIINSIQKCSEDVNHLISILEFYEAMDLLSAIIDKSMPQKEEENNESIFEEEEDDITEDWDFSYMEYLWSCILKRQDDFYNITPNHFFKMIEHHKRFNGVKEDTEKVEYI